MFQSLKLSSVGRKGFTTGEIVNLVAVDTQRVFDFTLIYNLLWSAPLQITIAFFLLYNQLGLASLAGIGVLLLLLPYNAFVSVALKNLILRVMQHKDKRAKLMNEILNGIKVLKLYAWENAFIGQVCDIRSKEVAALNKRAYYGAAIGLTFACSPFFVSINYNDYDLFNHVFFSGPLQDCPCQLCHLCTYKPRQYFRCKQSLCFLVHF